MWAKLQVGFSLLRFSRTLQSLGGIACEVLRSTFVTYRPSSKESAGRSLFIVLSNSWQSHLFDNICLWNNSYTEIHENLSQFRSHVLSQLRERKCSSDKPFLSFAKNAWKGTFPYQSEIQLTYFVLLALFSFWRPEVIWVRSDIQ